MYLESIELINYRIFKRLSINFNNRMTVLVGNNGSGKSTVLEACAAAVSVLTSQLETSAKYRIEHSDVRNEYYHSGESIDVTPQYPLIIRATGTIDDNTVSWERIISTPRGKDIIGSHAKSMTDISQAYGQRIMDGDQSLILPVIAYYNTGRLWNRNPRKQDIDKRNTRLNGYSNCFEANTSDYLLNKWFQKMTIQEYQKDKDISVFRAVKKAMEHVFSSITGHNNVKVQYNLDTSEIDILYFDSDNSFARMPLSRLSDGYRCTISLIADIAYRMAVLNPQLLDSVLVKTPGVILIDEVDLHLHPSWQKRILGDLQSVFPGVQFIVSTHAPEVINSVSRDSIVILKDSEATSALNQTYGRDSNTILREVMDVSTRPDKVTSLLKQFYNLLDKEEFESAGHVLLELENLIGENDPELSGCRISLELERM